MAEYELMMHELTAGKRTRAAELEQEQVRIRQRALAGLRVIMTAIDDHPGTGQVGRLVRFLARLYNGTDYPLDLSDLRVLDTPLANACLDYLNYDRLGIRDLDREIPGGAPRLRPLILEYGLEAVRRE